MSVYGRVEEVHKKNREPLEYQIEQESHHRESSRLPFGEKFYYGVRL